MKISFCYGEKEFVVDCSMFNAKEIVYVNGSLVSQKRNFINLKSVHRFDFSEESYELQLRLKLLQGLINAILIKNGQAVHEQDFNMKGKAFSVNKIIIPKWSYIFIVSCGIIPFISLGGAIPGILGIGGAGTCISISRNSRMQTFVKIILCIITTILAWLLFLVLILVIRSFKKG